MKRHSVLAVVLCLPIVLFGGTCVVQDILFGINVEGRLKRAADANSVELAIQEMDAVVTYLEVNHMTGGYTSILYRTPDEDVGFWYQNLKSALEELKRVRPETTPLERTNILMKLMETLIDSGENGKSIITIPRGIAVFPHNTLYCLWAILGGITAIVGVVQAFLKSI
ncbi:hypothetical protein HYZ98_01655 [Candidatus Peregrinibacteria bacterium]|nr:hypothetical protein [Candidatus Peregrinibacteria bacterium]